MNSSCQPMLICLDQVPAQTWRNGRGQTRELLTWSADPVSDDVAGISAMAAARSMGSQGSSGSQGLHGSHGSFGPLGSPSSSAAAPSDWNLRLSVADIEQDGPFSRFPGVQRWFAMLRGAVQLEGLPGINPACRPGDLPRHFDGALAVDCRVQQPAAKALNLMLRGLRGRLQPVVAGWTPEQAQGLAVGPGQPLGQMSVQAQLQAQQRAAMQATKLAPRPGAKSTTALGSAPAEPTSWLTVGMFSWIAGECRWTNADPNLGAGGSTTTARNDSQTGSETNTPCENPQQTCSRPINARSLLWLGWQAAERSGAPVFEVAHLAAGSRVPAWWIQIARSPTCSRP